ncbi:MAG: hypothetical protein HFI20_08950 [Lachnospiraceae bacterium]|jgi:hypothetical protein|nr:hypothetical protein [Lachnospiraceae bacterium]MCI9304954.1 hypothetical protein [Lachnospiraceae bacterium]
MKSLKKIWILVICGLLLLTGCKKEEEPSNQPEEAKQQEGQENTEQEQYAEEPEDKEQGQDSVERELTSEELRKFTQWINQVNNYGFLLSEYTQPQDVDLSQVFYIGAGIENTSLSEEEEAAYLKITGDEEIYTDCTRLTTDRINEVLEKKLGLTLDDMSRELSWVYLPDSDAWVWQHGDTNYVNFTCVSGRQLSEDTYELECVPGDENYEPLIPSCRLTLQKHGEDYRFLSNIYTAGVKYSKEIWKIEEQSFHVDLGAPWGDVYFASYAPDKSAYGNPDVTFSIIKPSDGAELFKLPAVVEENYLRNEVFNQIQAVSFKDYDGDGNTDIIIIVEYQMTIHTEEGDKRQEVRLYRSRPEEGDFILDMDRMDYLNMNGYNDRIETIMEHIDNAGRPE